MCCGSHRGRAANTFLGRLSFSSAFVSQPGWILNARGKGAETLHTKSSGSLEWSRAAAAPDEVTTRVAKAESSVVEEAWLKPQE